MVIHLNDLVSHKYITNVIYNDSTMGFTNKVKYKGCLHSFRNKDV